MIQVERGSYSSLPNGEADLLRVSVTKSSIGEFLAVVNDARDQRVGGAPRPHELNVRGIVDVERDDSVARVSVDVARRVN